MTTYKLLLSIDDLVLQSNSSDNLCIGRKVGDAFTTVFLDAAIKPKTAGQKSLGADNILKWLDKFRVFVASPQPSPESLIEFVSNHVNIAFGQQAVLNSLPMFEAVSQAPASDFTNPTGPESSQDSFLARRIPKDLRVGIEMGLPDDRWTVIYVDNETHMTTSDIQITPRNEYIIFWKAKTTTNSAINLSQIPDAYKFSFDKGADDISIRFGYAIPNRPDGRENPNFYPVV